MFLASLGVFGGAYAGTSVTVPVTFTANTAAKAADVNSNFTALAAAINASNSNIAALQNSVAAVGFNYQGVWGSTKSYAINAVVVVSGSSYVALRATTGVNPATDVTNSGGNWGLIALAGAAGNTGSVGNTGPAGPAGPAGVPGGAGPVGSIGPQGPAGPTGPAGPAGATGGQGSQGSQGVAGPQGPAGVTGGAVTVVDSNGTVIGPYLSYPALDPSTSSDGVFIRTSAGSFALGFSKAGFASIANNSPFAIAIFFISTNCSGTPYFEITNWPTHPGAYPAGYVNGSTAYFFDPGTSTVLLTSNSFLANASGGGGVTCFTVSNSVNGFLGGTFDLSTLNLVPPFRVK